MTAAFGEVSSARNQIEFLRSVAIVNSTSDTTYTTQSKPKRARISLALKHLTRARLALKPSSKSERQYIDGLKLLEADMSAEAAHRDSASRARDNLIADLILAWERWGGEIGASFQDHSGTGPLVRFLVASVGDIFTLTETLLDIAFRNSQKSKSRQLLS